MTKAHCHWINGTWCPSAGPDFASTNPATDAVIWQGSAATKETIDQAVQAALGAFPSWSAMPLVMRAEYLIAFSKRVVAQKEEIAKTISEENGKPLWEALSEVNAIVGKVDLSIAAQAERCPEITRPVPQGNLVVRHRPHGVLAVLGPFNFPGHLPHGHIIPALLAGNTLVFKPSELTPLVGKLLMKCWEEAGLPHGVLNMIQGASSTGQLLTQHPYCAGILFTGSWNTGHALSELWASRPDKILALEMGGNNPLVIGTLSDLPAAAYTIVQSAFITSGQRCTCARRLIVPRGEQGDALIHALLEMVKSLHIAPYTVTPEPFMGPVISIQAAQKIAQAYQQLLNLGGSPLVPLQTLPIGKAFLSPGIVDMTAAIRRFDEEIFGPVLQIFRTDSLEESIDEANNTSYGLSSGLLSDKQEEFDLFSSRIRAGVVNWNTPLTGASSHAPFGGVGRSGNNRPSGYWAADYCSYPTTSLESLKLTLPQQKLPGIGYLPPSHSKEECCG